MRHLTVSMLACALLAGAALADNSPTSLTGNAAAGIGSIFRRMGSNIKLTT